MDSHGVDKDPQQDHEEKKKWLHTSILYQIDSQGVDKDPQQDHEEKKKLLHTSILYKIDSQGVDKDPQQDHEEKKKWLHAKYSQLLELMNRFPNTDKLSEIIPNFETTIHQQQSELNHDESVIRITGNTGFEKILDVLLRNTELPIPQIANSKCLYEIKRHLTGQKNAIFHFSGQNDGKRRKVPIILDLQQAMDEFIKRIQDQRYLDQFKKVEIFWSLPYIQGGVVLSVDTREGHMTKCQSMEGLIYFTTVDSIVDNEDLSSQVCSVSSDTVLIVCQIDKPDDNNDIKGRALQTMENVKPDLTQNQLCFLTNIDKSRQDDNVIHSQIEDMYPSLLRNSLCRHYEWMSTTVEGMISLNNSLFETQSEELVDKTHLSLRLSQQSTALNNGDTDITYRIKDCIKSESQTLCDQLVKFLKTDSGHQTLISWEPDDCPKADGNWKSIAKNGWDEIKCRVSIHINKWVSSTKVVEKVERKIVRIIEGYFDLNEEESLEIKKQLKADDKSSLSASLTASTGSKSSISNIFKSPGKDSAKRKMYSRGLGGAVVKDVSLETEDKTVKYLFKPYKASICCEVMTEATKLFLNMILDTDSLKQPIRSHFEPLENKLQNVTKTIKEMFEKNENVLQTLNSEIGKLQSNTTVQKHTRTKCVTFLSHLDVYFARHLVHEHFNINDLTIDIDDVSRGDMYDIFPGEIHSELVTRQVAVKMSRKVISEDNATAIMVRAKRISTLSHANLVKYYGTVIWRQKKGKRTDIKLLLLLELFPQSLLQYCSSENHTYPAKADDGSRDLETLKTAEFVSQICKGLAYIHSRHLVYGCLRTSHVFITSSGVVKLKDVDFIEEGKILQNQDNTSVYTAPELLKPGVVIATSADVYSLAMVIWELWYGTDPVEHISTQLFTSLRTSVKRGLRPSLSCKETPPENWTDIIRRCWEYDPHSRPDARTVCDFFEGDITKLRSTGVRL